MTKFSNKLKKPCFWPILGPFSQFWGKKKFFSKNPALPCTTPYEFLAPCQISEKLMIQFQENAWTEGRMGRTEGRTDPILEDLSGYSRGPKTDRHEDIQMDTKAKNKNLKTKTVSCQCWSPR